MDKFEVESKLKQWHQLGVTRIDRVELIQGLAETDDVEVLLVYNDQLETETRSEYSLTDSGNADHIIYLHSDTLRYDHRRNRWLEWHKHYWRPDTNGQIVRLALKAIREQYKAALHIEDLDQRAIVARWAIASESRARIDSAIALARNFTPIADDGESWDLNPWLFGVSNGVIDLKTGELRAGQQSDKLTIQSTLEYNIEARAPRWQSFLQEIFGGNTELVDWLQILFGYALTGDTREQIIPIGYGGGANGKTKLAYTLRNVMGGYAYDAPFSTFELNSRSEIPNDLAALVGKRFVTSSETNPGTRLNEARIKALTGGDSITARFLHQEFFTYQPMAKFFLAVNHKPRVNDDSYGFWRRVRLIPFEQVFRGANDDKELQGKLDRELPGILNWLIEGCLQWQREGLEPIPDCVKTATDEYEVDSNPLSQFILEECVIQPQAQIKASDLYRLYTQWCMGQGYRDKEIMTSTLFGRRMGDNFKKSHGHSGIRYFGVGSKGDGLVTGLTPDGEKSTLFPLEESRVGDKGEIHTQPVNSSFLNDYPSTFCPVCQTDENWELHPDGYYCCGEKEKR